MYVLSLSTLSTAQTFGSCLTVFVLMNFQQGYSALEKNKVSYHFLLNNSALMYRKGNIPLEAAITGTL